MSEMMRRARERRIDRDRRNEIQEQNAVDTIREMFQNEWFVDDAIRELRGHRLPDSFSEIKVGDKIKILRKKNHICSFINATVADIISENVLRIRELTRYGSKISAARFVVFVRFKDDFVLKLEEMVQQFDK